MGNADHSVILYSAQAEAVLYALRRDGVCFSRREYVVRKYGESAPIFVAAYDWFAAEMKNYVPRPVGAEYPYWAFRNLCHIERPDEGGILKLRVPADQAVFFDLYDWNKVMRLQYIGETKEDEERFRRQLGDYGIRRESDVILTQFYPELKRQVQQSWKRLFRHHERIRAGEAGAPESVQAGLWQLKEEWLADGGT